MMEEQRLEVKPEYFKKFPWLKEKNLKIILHNDFDGILSGIFLNYINGWQVIGFYDLETIWYDKSLGVEELKSAIWADIDISQIGIKSIGHHILKFTENDNLPRHSQSLNPNLERGIDRTQFWRKYPLGTIHFLLHIFNYDFSINTHPLFKFLLWHPNSTIINAQNYTLNVKDWLENFVKNSPMISDLDDIQTEKFEVEMENKFYPAIHSTGFERGRAQTISRFRKLGGFQCGFNNPSLILDKINKLVTVLSNITGWGKMKIPTEYQKINGKRNKTTYKQIKDSFNSLDDFLDQKEVFSYSIPYKNSVSYTDRIKF